MTVEEKAQETNMAEAAVVDQEVPVKAVKDDENEVGQPKAVEKCSSYREESNFLSDLKEFERKALNEMKSKLEEAILGKTLLEKDEQEKKNDCKESERDAAEEEEKDGECEEGTEGGEGKKPEVGVEGKGEDADRDVSIWGVPLLPSKGAEGTDVILLKFLRAREFKVNEAFEMLKKTLQWRKDFKVDSVLDESFPVELSSAAYMNGTDKEGHPVCYNVYGVFDNEEIYQKTFGTEEKREQFLRWRFQLMEKGIQKLDLRPGGVTSLLQINDLKNSPGPTRKELKIATKQVVALLQDNYPELVAKNIFINTPFWIYALNALLSPFLTRRTKSKFVFARPAKVTETLLKYVPVEEIPAQYGGFKRETDSDFSNQDGAVSEIFIKAGSTETIEIPAEEVGTTLVWDITILGWEVNYKEEFVPNDEGSYAIIVRKSKKMGSLQEPVQNTFRNNEPGKIVITIENVSSKKKRVMYRYKIEESSSV